MLDGNPLGLYLFRLWGRSSNLSIGHFAVKKIAVGESHSYLLKILREVNFVLTHFYIG